jgi:hypothetical protein
MTGADSLIREREYLRVTTMAEWAAVWQRHKGEDPDKEYDFYYDPLGLPLVDFDRYMVIAIFQGSGWNRAGVVVDSINEEPDRTVLRFRDKTYQTEGSDGGGQVTTPYGFFVIPRAPKALVLEEGVRRYTNDPPEWRERITFSEQTS